MKWLLGRHNIPHPAISLAAESEAVLHPGLGCHSISLASLQEREKEPELGVGLL